MHDAFDTSKWNQFLLWQRIEAEADRGDLLQFDDPAEAPKREIELLAKLLRVPQIWLPLTNTALTRRRGDKATRGYPGGDYCVLNYLIVEGDPERAAALCDEIDWGWMEKHDVASGGERDRDAYTTYTTMEICDAPATAILFWARRPTDDALPDLPVEWIIDLVKSLNQWGRSLRQHGLLLSSARLDVRVGGRLLSEGQVKDGRGVPGRLVAIGSFPSDLDPAEALRKCGSGLQRHVLEVASTNPWWAPAGDAPVYYDDPRNAIFV